MQGVLRVNGRPAKIKLRVKVRGLPAGASVDVTDLMLQPGAAVSGWLPHTTELPWSAGMTFLNTSPGGDLVFWDDIEGKPVVFPPETHTHLWKDIADKPTEFPPAAHSHGAGEIKSGVFDPARIPVLGTENFADQAVTSGKLSAALQDLLDQHAQAIGNLQEQISVKNISSATADLNDYRTTGRWVQAAHARALSGKNYPVPRAGFLEVMAISGGDVYQTYTIGPAPGNGKPGQEPLNEWKRGYYSWGGYWGEWVLVSGGGVADSKHPPTNQITYHWASAPHASESIKRIDGLEVARNYVHNPSLETNGTGWTPYSWTGTAERNQGEGAVGEWFYRLTAGATLTGNRGRYRDHSATVAKGEDWTLSVFVRPSRTLALQARGEFRAGASAVGSMKYGDLTECPAGEWTRLHVTLTASDSATGIRQQVYLHAATMQKGDTLDIDGEMVSRGPVIPYFDGDTDWGTSLWLDRSRKLLQWNGESWAPLGG